MVTPALRLIKGGMLTTVQDLGRWGRQHLGVPVAGPMDWYSHRLANRRVGNAEGAAALEITLIGPELIAEGDVRIAMAGADFELTVDGRPVGERGPVQLRDGQRLRFGERRAGVRASLAVQGGFDLPEVLGSRSTSLTSRLGPFGGRPLKAGDVLTIGRAVGGVAIEGRGLRLPRGGARLRVILGPHEERFYESSVREFSRARFTITPESNRMGYRLDGPPLRHAGGADLLSDATPMGSLQVPASGLPILLMADRQTTGGYPKIATVITADLPLAGQLAPADWVEFVPCARAAAVDALRARVADLQGSHA